MGTFVTEAEKARYREQGYIVKRGAIPPEEIAAFKADIQDIVEKAAAGEGPDVPWINKEKRLPARCGQILRPGYQRPSFVRLLEEGPFFPVGEQLMDFPARYCLCTFVANGDG